MMGWNKMPNIRLYPDQETIALLNGGATAFVIPWDKQPPSSTVGCSKELHTTNYICFDCCSVETATYKSPCQPGDTVFLLEPWDMWRETLKSDNTPYLDLKLVPIYKADYSIEDLGNMEGFATWRSPVTMPNKACRHVMKVGKVEAVQVKDIVGHQANLLGFCKELHDHELLHSGGYRECKIAFREWFTTTYPHLNMDSWLWYIEKGE